eukprot:gene30054-30814_t
MAGDLLVHGVDNAEQNMALTRMNMSKGIGNIVDAVGHGARRSDINSIAVA